MAACASLVTGRSAGQPNPGAAIPTKLTFQPDHSLGAGHMQEPLRIGVRNPAAPAGATDDRSRFRSSRAIGVFLGLTAKRYQAGETDRVDAISNTGDPAARRNSVSTAHRPLTEGARLEEENIRLKRLVADLSLNKEMLPCCGA
jgi:transposase